MPGRDGTGPSGRGSKTGRGLGNCSDLNVNQSKSQVVNPAATAQPGPGGRFWDGVFRLFLRNRNGQRNRR